jgi:uncharacterized protein (TIGR02444 family)
LRQFLYQSWPGATKLPNDANPLWDFAVDFYRREGMETHCITLQDTAGEDVNCLLLCCWCGVEGIVLDSEELAVILSTTAWQHWRSRCIEALRGVRRELGRSLMEGAGSMRERVLAVELEVERLALNYLFRQLQRMPLVREAPSAGLLCRNLQAYRKACAGEPLPVASLLPFLRTAFPAIDEVELKRAAEVSLTG